MILWLLLQAAAPAEAPIDPFGTLRGNVVSAIRNCGVTITGEIVVCSRDRGFAEKQRRLEKLKKPRVVESGSGITFEVTTGDGTPPPPPSGP
jgi:hypothetical protein